MLLVAQAILPHQAAIQAHNFESLVVQIYCKGQPNIALGLVCFVNRKACLVQVVIQDVDFVSLGLVARLT